MIVIAADLLRQIVDAAERAYPEECCGLLVGQAAPDRPAVVTRVEPSRNLTAGAKRTSFEVDPRLTFALLRELRQGPHRIVGLYHSHPDRPATPSERDLAMAFEPELVWLILSVAAGRVTDIAAFLVDRTQNRFRKIAIQNPLR